MDVSSGSSWRWWSALSLVLFGLLPIGGCEEEARFCYPGDYRRCGCEGGTDGFQQCDDAGEAYGVCDCSGAIPGLTTGSTGGAGGGAGGAGAGGAGGDGGKLPFLAPCDEDAQCETMLCYPFTAKGPHCSQTCSGPEDCPAPSTGCNMMGVCKVP
jgi:hypothetical protein